MENDNRHRCQLYNRIFTRSNNLQNHIKTKHNKVSLSFSCYLCRKSFKERDKDLKHIDNHKEGRSFVLYKQPFDKTIQIFRKHFQNYFSLNDISNETEDIQSLIYTRLPQYPKYKVNFLVQIEYTLKGENNLTLEREIFHIRISNFVVSKAYSSKNLKKIINSHLFEIFSKENHMNLPQSGWVSNKIISIDVNLHKIDLVL